MTGGLGAGKSTVLRLLAQLGAATLSTDAVVHELYGTPGVRSALRTRWGEEVVAGDAVDRPAVARRVFADPAERIWLEGLLWPLVAERVVAFRDDVLTRRPRPPVGVVETPLLFEAGMDAAYDATIAVIADDELRSRRAAARGHESLAARELRQLSQDEKARRATHVITNSGTVADLEAAVARVLAEITTGGLG
ncbi:MAG TPA: dephospho-CoA kinase [Solirubrobacteraceae bacterium]|nr:dephospho-CoA kinase [Solirubrobacteraceae bacterium]